MRHSTLFPKKNFAFDLHVLSTPPAFVLSQDQTLQFDILRPLFRMVTYIVLNYIRALSIPAPKNGSLKDALEVINPHYRDKCHNEIQKRISIPLKPLWARLLLLLFSCQGSSQLPTRKPRCFMPRRVRQSNLSETLCQYLFCPAQNLYFNSSTSFNHDHSALLKASRIISRSRERQTTWTRERCQQEKSVCENKYWVLPW